MSQTFSLEAILAISLNNAIGLNGKLPWNLPIELKLFKEITMHHALIMGRKTFESLPGPLPNREHIIISNTMHHIPGIHLVTSVEHALSLAEKLSTEKVFAIGGKSIFDALIPQCSAIHVSRIMGEFKADTFHELDLKGYSIEESHGFRDTETGIDILYQKHVI